jgi:hypothetical protein
MVVQAQEVFQRQPHGGVVQDKKPPRRLDTALSEPPTATAQPPTATEQLHDTPVVAVNRQNHHGSETRQTAQITGRVPLHVKSEVLRIADMHNWTESYTVNTLVQKALAQNLGEQFAVMIQQTVAKAVQTEMYKHGNWLAKLALSGYLAAEQGRILQIEHLRYVLPQGVDLAQIIANSQSQSHENLKFYNYSIEDVKQKATETVPWQSSK